MPNSRSMLGVCLFALACRVAICDLNAQDSKPAAPHITVGANILASRDGDFAHVEMMDAVDQHDPANLLGASIVFAHPGGSVSVRPYVSTDGGFTWDESAPATESDITGADPQVGYGLTGTAYFLYMQMTEKKRPDIAFYRSRDHGKSWEPPASAGDGDHPQLVVDQTFGRFAGRVYIGVLVGHDYTVGVLRSEDDGRSFIGPVSVAKGAGDRGINVGNLMVLSDGTLLVPFCDFTTNQDKNRPKLDTSICSISTSTDGGISFSEPVVIGSRTATFDPPRLANFPQFAADNSGGKFDGSVYASWSDFREGVNKISFAFSHDRGKTWSSPAVFDAASSGKSLEFQPAIAVNKDGVVGLIWSDSRGLPDDQYNVYFAASTDGGQNFLPSVKVSDEVSHRRGAGNLRLALATWKLPTEESARLVLVSPGSRWAAGGDYVGLAADVNGAFHPLWADARSGTFQMYTAKVKVDLKPAPAESNSKCPPQRTDVTEDVALVNDPSQFNSEEREADLPVRLKNTSKQPIYKPITLQVDGFGSGMGKMWAEYAPTILNATNKKTAAGAEFDFSPFIGTSTVLLPGEETGAMMWKLQLPSTDFVPDFHYRVFGNRSAQNCAVK